MSEIADISLAKSGRKKIDWVASYMPVLGRIRREFSENKPFAGLRISMSIHMEAKTAYLAETLQRAEHRCSPRDATRFQRRTTLRRRFP